MNQDEPSSGGLLSKVVKFVRKPTANWSDLDQPEAKESQYSKQMLKEMIERKRANDFVRRREFDQLRKLRQRHVQGGASLPDGAGRTSFFQSSQPSESGDRVSTLKKIDEIEAQMAQQWWTSKKQAVEAATGAVAQAPAEPPPASYSAYHARQYATTIHATFADAAAAPETDFPATDILPMNNLGAASPERTQASEVLDENFAMDWSSTPSTQSMEGMQSTLGADEDGGVFVHDPVLEEAAIRFANGDDAGAEAVLQALLAPGAQAKAPNGVWLALFDLYRATGRRSHFEALAIDYAARIIDAAPSWAAELSLSGQPALSTAARWVSPGVLGAAEVLQLQSLAELSESCVLVLDWSALSSIDDAAVGPLTTVFTHWADLQVSLHVHAAGRLDELLRGHTVSGERGAPSHWWLLRMAWLCITHRADAHELVALDYCITYEVSPPDWRDATCAYVSMDGDGALAASQAWPDAAPRVITPAVAGALSGVITGDAAMLLDAFGRPAVGAGPTVIDCAQLVRIDFAAAGAVLNWAVMQQGAGRQVQFIGLHRLVATFFSVIGMGEYAAIFLRRH